MTLLIDGEAIEMVAVSGQASLTHAVAANLPATPRFKTIDVASLPGGAVFSRSHDVERNLLENAAMAIEIRSGSTGRIRMEIVVDNAVCEICIGVIARFTAIYPKSESLSTQNGVDTMDSPFNLVESDLVTT